MMLQARAAPQLVDLMTSAPLAPKSRPISVLNTPQTHAYFAAGDGGPLAISAAGGNGAIVEGNAYTAWTAPLTGNGATVVETFCGINPTARGSMRAASTDPSTSVFLDSNLLGNEQDVDTGVRCLERFQDIHTELTPALGLEFIVPGPDANGEGLVEASMLPEMPPFAGPAATVYMLAELASEIIVADNT
eukprot:jgi/Ulvmu1/1764/UM118_0003.1